MISKTAWMVLVGMGLVALGGCAANTDEDASESEGAASKEKAALTAKVTSRAITKDSPKCKIDVKRPLVETTSTKVTAEIAKETRWDDAESYCKGLEADESLDVEGAYEVVLNEQGLLSIELTESVFLTPSAHPSHSLDTRTFDLATGKKLAIGDVLEESGKKIVRDACIKKLTTPVEGDSFYDAEGAGLECDKALDDSSGSAKFVLGKDGFRLFLDLPHALFGLGAEGALAPWSDLRGKVRPLVAKLASAPKE